MGRILALDVGSRRIGYAFTDPCCTIAQPGGVILRKGRDRDVARLAQLARQLEVERIVVGAPLSGRGLPGAISLGRRLGRRLGVDVWVVDEDFTTVEAQELLIEAGMSRARRREVVDKIAAAIILQAYLRGGGRRVQ